MTEPLETECQKFWEFDMDSHTNREIAELLSITGCNGDSSRTVKLRIALPDVKQESTSSAPSSRKPKQHGVAAWVILLLLGAVTGALWATNQLCGLMAQRVQQIQQQRYHP